MTASYCADGIGLLLPISISRGYSNSKMNSSLIEANDIDGWWRGGGGVGSGVGEGYIHGCMPQSMAELFQ